jgi:hypothetical protein
MAPATETNYRHAGRGVNQDFLKAFTWRGEQIDTVASTSQEETTSDNAFQDMDVD